MKTILTSLAAAALLALGACTKSDMPVPADRVSPNQQVRVHDTTRVPTGVPQETVSPAPRSAYE